MWREWILGSGNGSAWEGPEIIPEIHPWFVPAFPCKSSQCLRVFPEKAGIPAGLTQSGTREQMSPLGKAGSVTGAAPVPVALGCLARWRWRRFRHRSCSGKGWEQLPGELIPRECGCGEAVKESWDGWHRGELKAHPIPSLSMGQLPLSQHVQPGTSRDLGGSMAFLGILAGSSSLRASTGSCSKLFPVRLGQKKSLRSKVGWEEQTAVTSRFVPLWEFSGNILFTALLVFHVEMRNSSLVPLFSLFSRGR